MKTIIAIDPGASGGIAVMSGDLVEAFPMPEGMCDQVDKLLSLVVAYPHASAVLEKVGTYMPGNSGPSAATFARHCGHLEAALYCFGVPTEQVAPAKWMKAMGSLPVEKPARKAAIKELMARRYPTVTVTLKTADALGLLTWKLSQSHE